MVANSIMQESEEPTLPIKRVGQLRIVVVRLAPVAAPHPLQEIEQDRRRRQRGGHPIQVGLAVMDPVGGSDDPCHHDGDRHCDALLQHKLGKNINKARQNLINNKLTPLLITQISPNFKAS